MIIHPSSAFLTAEPLRWETMREEPAPGPHPRRKSAADKLESRVPGSESRGTELRFFVCFFSNDSAKWFFFHAGAPRRGDRGVRKGKFSLLKRQKKSISETSKHLRQD